MNSLELTLANGAGAASLLVSTACPFDTVSGSSEFLSLSAGGAAYRKMLPSDFSVADCVGVAGDAEDLLSGLCVFPMAFSSLLEMVLGKVGWVVALPDLPG